MTVNRRALGELTVAPVEVTAGSTKDFKFTYKASDALSGVRTVDSVELIDVVEIRLPAWDAYPSVDTNDTPDNTADNTPDPDIDPPMLYQHDDEIPATETGPYLQLSGSSL